MASDKSRMSSSFFSWPSSKPATSNGGGASAGDSSQSGKCLTSNELKTVLNDISYTFSKGVEENNRLHSEIDRLKAKVFDSDRQVEEKNRLIVEQEIAVEKAQNEAERKDEENAWKEKVIQELRTKLRVSEQEQQEAEKELQQEVDYLKKRLMETEKKLEMKETSLGIVQSQLATLENRNLTKRQENEQLLEKVNSNKAEIDELTDDNGRLRDDQYRFEKFIRQLKKSFLIPEEGTNGSLTSALHLDNLSMDVQDLAEKWIQDKNELVHLRESEGPPPQARKKARRESGGTGTGSTSTFSITRTSTASSRSFSSSVPTPMEEEEEIARDVSPAPNEPLSHGKIDASKCGQCKQPFWKLNEKGPGCNMCVENDRKAKADLETRRVRMSQSNNETTRRGTRKGRP